MLPCSCERRHARRTSCVHRYWSVVENRRVADDRVVQVRLDALELRHPRQWGACWLACLLWDLLGLDTVWLPRLLPSRKGTRWRNVLKVLTVYRLIDPGSEWRF